MMEDMMALHRVKLETDRQARALRQLNTRSPIVPSRESLEGQRNAPQPKRRIPPKSPPYTGLRLGGYEQHQKNLKAQAAQEYQQYLQKQKPRSGFQASPLITAEKQISKQPSPRSENRQEAPQNDENMDEAYQKLLERKREIERKYRAQTGDFTTPNSKENEAETQKRVHFDKDDDLSRAVKRLGALSTYDKELEDWNAMRSGALDRGIKSAREERVEAPMTQQDRSKSVPHEDNRFVSNNGLRRAANFETHVGGAGATPEDRKKKYADDLRKQMDEQRKAKLKTRNDYYGSPSTKSKVDHEFTSPNIAVNKPSPLERADESVRQRLNTKFEKLSPEPAAVRPGRIPQSPVRESPGRLPQYPQGGYFPPPGYNMYPPYMMPPQQMMQQGMYPPYMMPQQQMMQPGMMPPNMGGMMPQQMGNNGMMRPQMMNGGQQLANNTQYDPYQNPQYYGLERRRSGESRERRPREPAGAPPQNRSQPRNVETIADPAITRITDIGANNNSPKPQKGNLDPSDYARELKRQVEERERAKNKKKEEQEMYDRKKDEECANYNPWGRGGAGAPLKDAQGQSVANRNQMKANAQDPITLQKEQKSRVVAAPPPVEGTPDKAEGAHFGRVNEITGTPQEDDPVKIAAKQDYKSFLQQQIDERARLKAEQKEKERLEDEKEMARLEKERLRLKAEFEAELKGKKEKEEAQQQMNEDLKRAAEERRKDQEKREASARKRREDNEKKKQEDEQRQAQEQRQEPQSRMQPPAFDQRGRSPPVPTLAKQQDGPKNSNRESIVIPTHAPKQEQPSYANRQDQPPYSNRESIVIPTHANRQQEPARESIVIPTHAANRQSPPVPKLDLSGRIETDAEGDLRPSDRRPPSNLGPSRSNGGTPKSGDVTKDHVMSQLSALRTQLNRLQNVKSTQNELGKPVTIAGGGFDTDLDRAAKRRNPAAPAAVRADYDNLSLLSQDLRDRYELFSGHDELGDKFRNIQLQDRDSLDGQCSSEFVACTPEPTQLLQSQGSTQNNRYKRPPSDKRPPSGTSIQSFDVHKIAQRNEERLRRLENMQSGRIFKEQSPDLILDAFLSDNNRPESEASLECETSYKPAF
ncbi:centrosome and spindle pole-associated protein 1-like isoform X2 [Bolinopsis microptera]|uniref:centrosome and spindle pole-associated protein 1-like isoform X2 n=1 Tax=Bolinopsis microptera TaxID=2820187 RepID=UPI003079EF1D